MSIEILVGVAVFDCFLLSSLWLYLRTNSPVDPRTFRLQVGGLLGFVFHALFFFSGGLRLLQLATLAVMLGLCWSSLQRHPEK